jgi:hypothetical protein
MKKNKCLQFLVTASVAISLVGCAHHLSQSECLTANWYALGFDDGVNAKPLRDLSGNIADCAKFKIKVDTVKYRKGWRAGLHKFCKPTASLGNQDGVQGRPVSLIKGRTNWCEANGVALTLTNYRQGWKQGIKDYCSKSNAYRLGSQGVAYHGICPSNLQRRFLKSYHKGLRNYCIPQVAEALAVAGKPKPSFCPPDLAVRFDLAYNRGSVIHAQKEALDHEIKLVQEKIDSLNSHILTNDIDLTAPHTPGERLHIRREQLARKQQLSHLEQRLATLKERLFAVQLSQ